MFNSVQFVRDLCKKRNIPIAKLEKDCGFANGYLNPKKMSKIPYDRAVIIAEYLGVSANLILTGEEEQKNNAPDQLVLTEDEGRILNLFRQVPADQQELVYQMICAALGKQR